MRVLLGLLFCLPLAACDSAVTGPVTIKMQDFDVASGAEMYKCQNFKNPFARAVDVDRFEAHMPAGAHHMIVFFVDDIDDGPLEDCSGTEFHGNVFGAQTPDSVMQMPAGIGVAIPAKTGLRLQLHYVNATQQDLSAGVTTIFHVAKPGSVTQHAGQLIFSNEDISIPPTTDGVPAQVTKTCTVPSAVSVIGASAHVHQHAVDFVATTDGNVLYHTGGGQDPKPVLFDPPVQLQANQGVTFTCSYLNSGTNTLVFGESAITNEMCVLGAIYYPVADVTFPNIPCF